MYYHLIIVEYVNFKEMYIFNEWNLTQNAYYDGFHSTDGSWFLSFLNKKSFQLAADISAFFENWTFVLLVIFKVILFLYLSSRLQIFWHMGSLKSHLVSCITELYFNILLCEPSNESTLQPLYNTVHYNKVWDITRFKDGSQKCIDNIEKMTINGHFSIWAIHFCLNITRLFN